MLQSNFGARQNFRMCCTGVGAHMAEVTYRPIPHGPVLLREAADGPERHCKIAQRTPGVVLQGQGCCCRCCRERVPWQLVTSAWAPQGSLLLHATTLKVCQVQGCESATAPAFQLLSSCRCYAGTSPVHSHHSSNSRKRELSVAASGLLVGPVNKCFFSWWVTAVVGWGAAWDCANSCAAAAVGCFCKQ